MFLSQFSLFVCLFVGWLVTQKGMEIETVIRFESDLAQSRIFFQS